MPDTKISGMTNGGAVVATDNIPAVRAGANVRVQVAAVAGSGAYADLSGRPTLGSAAAQDTSAFATAAQGTLAGTAVQPGAITGSGLTQATARLLGRSTAGTGAVEEITLGTNLSFTGTTLNAAGGGGSPGGSDGQIQRNNAGVFAGSNISQDAAGRITVAAGTQTTAGSALNLSYTANGAGQVINGLTVNMTDTASAAGSLPLDVQVGGVSRAQISKTGSLTLAQNATINLSASGFVNEIVSFGGANGIQINSSAMWGSKVAGSLACTFRQFGIATLNAGFYGFSSSDSTGTVDAAFMRNTTGIVEVNSGTAGQFRDLRLRNLIASQVIQTLALTVATLPAAASWPGGEAYVTDASSPTIGSTVAGGGSARAVVRSNGTNWIVTSII